MVILYFLCCMKSEKPCISTMVGGTHYPSHLSEPVQELVLFLFSWEYKEEGIFYRGRMKAADQRVCLAMFLRMSKTILRLDILCWPPFKRCWCISSSLSPCAHGVLASTQAMNIHAAHVWLSTWTRAFQKPCGPGT